MKCLYTLRSYKLFLIMLTCAMTRPCAKANSFEEYHTFVDTSGRSIEAKVLDYDPTNGKVQLERRNGKTGMVPADQLSEGDHRFLDLWLEAQQFLNNDLLEISIMFKRGYWDDTGDVTGDRDRRNDELIISLLNHGDTTLTNVTAEYCTYRERKEQIAAYNRTLEIGELTPAKSLEIVRKETSWKRGFKFRNILEGARFRFMMPLSNGTTLVREICIPKPLPLDDYPWVEGKKALEAEKASLPDPTDYPDKTMTGKDVKALAKQYIEAIEDEDFEAWKALMAPMHPGHASFTESSFKMSIKHINSIHILDIEELNVHMRVRNKRGNPSEGWLQIHSSGHIKYTPVKFKHPIELALNNVSLLLHKKDEWRRTGVRYLREAKVPLLNYKVEGNQNDWNKSVKQIMEWIEKNGGTHDPTNPKVFFPEEALKEEIELTERRIEDVPRMNDHGY